MAKAIFEENKLYAVIGYDTVDHPWIDASVLTAKVYKAVKRTARCVWLKDSCGSVYKCLVKTVCEDFEYVRAPKSGDIQKEANLALYAVDEIDPSDNQPGKAISTAEGRARVSYFEEV